MSEALFSQLCMKSLVFASATIHSCGICSDSVIDHKVLLD